MGYAQEKPTMIYCDNTSAVAIAKNPMYHKWTKHIDTKYYWVHKKIQAEQLIAEYICTEDQTANIFDLKNVGHD